MRRHTHALVVAMALAMLAIPALVSAQQKYDDSEHAEIAKAMKEAQLRCKPASPPVSVILAGLLLVATSGFMAANGSERIEGLITSVQRNEFVLSTDGGPIVVDVSDLGGVTAAIVEGQRIAVIRTMAPGGQTFHAIRLEPASEAQ